MPYLRQWSEKRIEHAKIYDAAFKGVKGITCPVVKNYSTFHIYNQYTLQAKDRDKLMAHLKAASIGCAVYYPLPLHLQECFSALNCPLGTFPAAEYAANAVLSLPVYPELTDEMKDYVVAKVCEFYA